MYSNGYKYRKKLTIDNTKLSAGTMNYFPMLVNHTDVDLKSVANGGKVRLNPLLDIRFETTAGDKMHHEIVNYVATTGLIEAYVNVPVIDSTAVNAFYIYYGKDLTQRTHVGINYGIGSADTFNIKRNWETTIGINAGEVTPYAVNVKDVNGNVLDVGSNKLIALAEDGTSYIGNDIYMPTGIDGFLMYTAATTQSRFGAAAPWNDHLVGVFTHTSNPGVWYYDVNGVFGTFTPVSTDILVAKLRWNTTNGASRVVDYADVIYAGESLPSYAWRSGITLYDEDGFGATRHNYRLVQHMNKAINTSTTWFESPESTVFSNVGSSANMVAGNLVDGIVGKAYDFDGTDDRMAIAASSVIWAGGNQSTSMWLKWDTTAGNQCIMGRRSGIGDTQAHMWWTVGGVFNVDLAGSVSRWNTGWTPTANTWYHVAVVIEPAITRLYVNGVQRATIGLGGTHGDSNSFTYLGASVDAGVFNNFFNGKICEIRFNADQLPARWYKAEYNNQNSPTTFYSQSVEDIAIELADTLHGHSVDGNLTLVEHKLLAVADATHALGSDDLILVEHKTLVTDDATHSQTVDQVTVTQVHMLGVDDTSHLHTAENVDLEQGLGLVPNDSLIGHIVDNTVLTQHHYLIVQDTLHAQTVDILDVITQATLSVNSTLHSHLADSVTLIEAYTLQIQNATHSQSADSIIKIINWDELGLYFGIYRTDFRDYGNITVAELAEQLILKSAFAKTGELPAVTIDEPGIYKTTFNNTGTL